MVTHMNRRPDDLASSTVSHKLRAVRIAPVAASIAVSVAVLAGCDSGTSQAGPTTSTTTAAPTTTTTQPPPIVDADFFPTDEFAVGGVEIPVAELLDVRADTEIPVDYPVRFAPEMDISNTRMNEQLQFLANHAATSSDGSIRVMPFAPHWTSTGSLRVLALIDNGGNEDLAGMSIDLTVFDRSPEGLSAAPPATGSPTTVVTAGASNTSAAAMTTSPSDRSAAETSAAPDRPDDEPTTSTGFVMAEDDPSLPDGANRTVASARFEVAYPTAAALPARSMELTVLEFTPSRVVEPTALLVRTSYDWRVSGDPG